MRKKRLTKPQRISAIIVKSLGIILNYFVFPFAVLLIFTDMLFNQQLFAARLIISFIAACAFMLYFLLRPVRDYKGLMNKSKFYIDIGSYEKAESMLQAFLTKLKLSSEEESIIYIKIAELSLRMDKAEQAEIYIKKALDLPADAFKRGDKLFSIGTAYLFSEHNSQAVYYYDQAFKIAFSYMDKIYMNNRMLLEIVKAYVSEGQSRKAADIYNKLLQHKRTKKSYDIEKILELH